MRIFLLPVSTRRTLLYCERLQVAAPSPASGARPPVLERVVSRATQTWAEWERADKGWRKQLVTRGNQLLSRIAFEEWGLKSLPPLTKARVQDVQSGKLKFECLYPARFLSPAANSNSAPAPPTGTDKDGAAHALLQRLATERQALHRRRMWTSIAWMPVALPFGLVPVIPNIPFFYLCFRAYSHYRALYGSQMLAHLTSTPGALALRACAGLEEVYARGLKSGKTAAKTDLPLDPAEVEGIAASALEGAEKEGGAAPEAMLLRPWSGRLLAEGVRVPEVQMEVERAVAQVEAAIAKETRKDGAA